MLSFERVCHTKKETVFGSCYRKKMILVNRAQIDTSNYDDVHKYVSSVVCVLCKIRFSSFSIFFFDEHKRIGCRGKKTVNSVGRRMSADDYKSTGKGRA